MADHDPADGSVEQDGSGDGDGGDRPSSDRETPAEVLTEYGNPVDDVTEELRTDHTSVDADEIADGTVDLSTVDRSESDTITMSVSVDVSDLDVANRRILHALADLFEENFMEVVEKNRDYDFSFLRTGSKLAATEATPFETATRSQVYGLLTRSGDKRERVIENVFGDGAAEVSDDPATTARECANYWLFIALVLSDPELADAFLNRDDTSHAVETSPQ